MNAGILALSAAGACAGVAAWAAVAPSSQLFGPTLRRTPDASQIALTFDDGPNPACTPELLKLLERYRAPATFFLVGRAARACPNLVREIADRGHNIGNHTQTHANLTWMPAWRIADELEACQDSILRGLGFERGSAPILMRPPFGYRGPQLWSAIRRARLQAVAMWSLTCYDWKPQPAERLIKRLGRLGRVAIRNRQAAGEESARGVNDKRKAAGGEIIMLHDGDPHELLADRRHVLAALEYWLPRWRDAGFEFVTMNPLADAS